MVQKNLRWMASLLLAANLAAVTPGTTFAAVRLQHFDELTRRARR